MPSEWRPLCAGSSVSVGGGRGVSGPFTACTEQRNATASMELAVRLGALLGNAAPLWADMQSKNDLCQAQSRLESVIKEMKPLKLAAQA